VCVECPRLWTRICLCLVPQEEVPAGPVAGVVWGRERREWTGGEAMLGEGVEQEVEEEEEEEEEE